MTPAHQVNRLTTYYLQDEGQTDRQTPRHASRTDGQCIANIKCVAVLDTRWHPRCCND